MHYSISPELNLARGFLTVRVKFRYLFVIFEKNWKVFNYPVNGDAFSILIHFNASGFRKLFFLGWGKMPRRAIR